MCNVVSLTKKDTRKLEGLYRAATKTRPDFKDLNCEEKVKEITFTTQEKRRDNNDIN